MLQSVAAASRRITTARVVSDWGSPPLFTALALLLVAGVTIPDWVRGLAWGLGLALLIAGLPLLYIALLVRRGVVTDMHLPHRRERLKPIIASVAAVVVAIGCIHLLAVPPLLQRLLWVLLVQACVLGLVTVWWKISFHAATVALYVGLALKLLGPVAAPLLILVPLIVWARLVLQRHTLAQVLAGSAVGLALALWI